ncbi:MAG: hypothetical protein EOO01_04835, partial [Chitinophagaceae bacterium]
MSRVLIVCLLFIASCAPSPRNHHNTIYTYDPNTETRWSSGENLNGAKGTGGRENNGAKGHPTDNIDAGTTRT